VGTQGYPCLTGSKRWLPFSHHLGYGGNRKTKLPLKPNTRIHAPEGYFGNSRRITIGRMPDERTSRSLDARLAKLNACPPLRGFSARPDPISAPRASGLGFVGQPSNPIIFCEPPQTPRVDSSHEPLPCTGSCPQLHLAFLATMRPALDPAGHRVPRAEPTCLSTPRRPRKAKTFLARLHQHQRKSSCNLHLQFSAKSQSTPHCQSLITPRSDHPPVVGRSSPQYKCLVLSLFGMIKTINSNTGIVMCLWQVFSDDIRFHGLNLAQRELFYLPDKALLLPLY
jgi:hypothetical protein